MILSWGFVHGALSNSSNEACEGIDFTTLKWLIEFKWGFSSIKLLLVRNILYVKNNTS